MMTFLTTFFYFTLAVATANVCGYGIVSLLLPGEDKTEDTVVASPATGYALASFVTILISSLLKLPAKQASLIAFSLLAIVTLVVLVKQAASQLLKHHVLSLIKAQALALPLALCILWPMFYAGADTYLGSVNTDFTYSLFDNYYLETHSVTSFNRTARKDTYRYTDANSGTAISSGRFGGNMFALLIVRLFKLPIQTAMVLAIAVFLYCLPLSLYFMARRWVHFSKTEACLSSLLIGISGLTCLSFAYCLIGQNSGLGMLPLTITVLLMLIATPAWKLLFYAALMLSSMFFIYAGMLPFAITPAAGLAIYQLWKKQIQIKALMLLIGKIIGIMAVINLALLPFLGNLLLDWISLILRPASKEVVPVFLEFLTELFFPLFLGLVTYPVNAQTFWSWLPQISTTLLLAVICLAVVFVILIATHYWRKKSSASQVKFTVLFTLGVYCFAWLFYSSISPKGYFIFKISSWLQFMLTLPFAFLIAQCIKPDAELALPRLSRPLFACIGAAFILCNAIVCYDTAQMSLGKDPVTSRIANAYNITGNRDYLTLANDLKKYIPPDKSVGLCFSEYVQTQLVSYQLKNYRISILSNPFYPSIDQENTVSLETVYPNLESYIKTSNPYFHGLKDDYVLMPAMAEISADFFDSSLAQPLWANKTFRLFKTSDLRDFLFVGNGWYKTEYKRSPVAITPSGYTPFRWLSNAGEIYMIHYAQSDIPYTLSFNVSAGEHYDRKRTVEIWHNEKLIDTQEMTGMAKLTSKTFAPSPLNKLVIKLKEKPVREFSSARWWNNNVFQSGLRLVNVAVSHVRVFPVTNARQASSSQLLATSTKTD
jgi:hypothetical protein